MATNMLGWKVVGWVGGFVGFAYTLLGCLVACSVRLARLVRLVQLVNWLLGWLAGCCWLAIWFVIWLIRWLAGFAWLFSRAHVPPPRPLAGAALVSLMARRLRLSNIYATKEAAHDVGGGVLHVFRCDPLLLFFL